MTTGKQDASFGISTLLADRSPELAAKRPLTEPIVVHGDVERLAAVVALPSLRSAVAVMNAWDGAPQTARAWSPAEGPAYEIFANREQLATLYDAGCTIVLEGVERFVPALRPLCRNLERDLAVGVGRINVEVFCARGVGVGRPHFDASFTFNCQLQGTKTWRLARHSAVLHPTTGMFLGRAPTAEFAKVLAQPLPANLDDHSEIVVAEPGTVVFLPPGVLHETRTETGSYAIAFAIERTDTLARKISDMVRTELQTQPDLRAARLGFQFMDIELERRLAASALRRLADQLESQNWLGAEPRYRLRPGLTAIARGETDVELKSQNVTRQFSLDRATVALLAWASEQSVFTVADVALGLPGLDPDECMSCLRQLSHRGLLESAS